MSYQVRQRLQSCLRASEFSPASFRGIVTGCLMAITMGDIALYYQLRSSISHGGLPWYTADVLIVTIGFMEAITAPFWSWFGRWRLRTLTIITCLTSVTAMGMMTMPSAPSASGSEFCTSIPGNPPLYSSVSTAEGLRLSIIIVCVVVNAIAKAAIWNIGIILMDQTEPAKFSLNYGFIISMRVSAMLIFPRFLNDSMALWTQAIGVFAPLLIHGFQFYRLPEPIPHEEKDLGYVGEIEMSVSASLGRIMSSGLAVGQIIAMALLAAPLWGYTWHLKDMVKMLYYIVEPSDFITTQADIIYYYALILAVVAYGMYYSRPRLSGFDKVSALKLATFASLLAAPLYCVQTLVLTCENGIVAGLGINYTQPACSAHCGCVAPFSEFSPVCVPDTMTTFMSPCHAGCTGQDSVGGLTVYTNCACAPITGSRRAVVGACSAVQCRSPYMLHKVLTPVIVIITVVVLQVQLVIVLRSVDVRDRTIAVGLSTAVVLIFTFVCGHLAYFGIRISSCAWMEGGRCLFHTPKFLQAIGGTSTGLVGVSFAISLTSWLIARRRAKVIIEDISLARRGSHEIETRA